MTDDLGDLILGETPKTTSQTTSAQPTSPKSSYTVNPKILDNLRQTESGGDALAVNKDTNALGAYQFLPTTVQMMHKQGIKFNPFDEKESRGAAEQYLGSLIEKNNGDVRAALAQYGGFKTKDPSAYVNKILKGVDQTTATQPSQTTQPTPQESDDPLGDLILNKTPTYKSTAGAGRGSYAGYTAPPSAVAGAGRGSYAGYSEDERRAYQVQQESNQRISDAAKAVYEVPRAIIQNTASQVAKGYGNIVGGLMPGPEGQSIEYGKRAQQVVPEFEPTSPVSKTVLNALNLPMEYGFQPAGKYAGDITQQVTGSPTAAGVVQGAIEASPMLLGLRGKKAPVATGEGTIVRGEIVPTDVPAVLRKQFAEKLQGPPKPEGYVAPEPIPTVEPTKTAPVTGVTAEAMAQPQKEKPSAIAAVEKPTEKITDQTSIPEPVAAPPVHKGVSKEIQNQKADVLQRVGFGTDELRSSAVNGDALQAAVDANMSKFIDHPLGEAAYNQLSKERQKLVDHAEQTIDATGGSRGADQSSLVNRGRTIDAPFKKFGDWFDEKTNNLYKAADEKSNGLPVVDPADIEALLSDREFNNTANAKNQQNLVTSIKDQLDLMKETNPEGLTVKNTEQFRKWLNTIWNKDNSSLIAKVKEQIDGAVLKHAGEDVYAQGRNLWKLRKETLEDPKGISKLFEFDPNTPINRRTAFEDLPNAVVNLDAEQYAHVINTLKNMPPELQPMAQKALAEIQAQHVNNMLAKGTTNAQKWNPKNVSTYRKANSQNIRMSFEDNPKALQMIDDLEAAGHILDYDPSYKGAASQAQSAMKRGFLPNLIGKGATTAGAGAGGAIAGPVGAAGGAALGEYLGGKAMSSAEAATAQKNWQKRMHKLSDIGKQ